MWKLIILQVFANLYVYGQEVENPAVINAKAFKDGHMQRDDAHGTARLLGDMLFTKADEQLYGINLDTEYGVNTTSNGASRVKSKQEITGKKILDTIRGSAKRWKLPVEYDDRRLSTLGKRGVQDAIKDFAKNTCIKFKPRSAGTRDYIRFIRGQGCYSYVGRDGGAQDISLGQGCEFQSTAVHEIMHALGFFHEQNRPDRDQYIKINFQNMIQGGRAQFQKQTRAETFGIEYDYYSVMHYFKKDFSSNGQVVMDVARGKPKVAKFGVHERQGGMTKSDAAALNKMYCNGGGNGNNAQWASWQQWSGCSKSCGGGTRERKRVCNGTPSNCKGLSSQRQACNTDGCAATGCEDKNRFCRYWSKSKANYCVTNNYVKTRCCKSCKATKPDCQKKDEELRLREFQMMDMIANVKVLVKQLKDVKQIRDSMMKSGPP